MSGTVGEISKLKRRFLVVLEKLRQRVERYFQKEETDAIGIYLGSEQLVFLHLRHIGHNWNIARVYEAEGYSAAKPAASLAKRVQEHLYSQGLDGLPLALCLPTELGKEEILQLPAHLSPLERQKAARYMLEEQNAHLQLSIPYIGIDNSSEDGSAHVTLFKREFIDDLLSAFTNAGCQVAYITYAKPAEKFLTYDDGIWHLSKLTIYSSFLVKSKKEQVLPALWATLGILAAADMAQYALNEQAELQSKWDYRRIALALLALVGTIAILILSVDLFSIWYLDGKLSELKSKNEGVAKEQDIIEVWENVRQSTEQKEAKLTAMSKETLPIYSTLVHFGLNTVQGVWLCELKLVDENELLLTGEAVDYIALANFLQTLEEDKRFLREAPLLEKSEQKENALNITFIIRLKI